MYQFTRPLVLEQSHYFQLTKKNGRHRVLNTYLKNFIKNIDKSKKENLDLDIRLKKLGLH